MTINNYKEHRTTLSFSFEYRRFFKRFLCLLLLPRPGTFVLNYHKLETVAGFMQLSVLVLHLAFQTR